MTARFTPSLLAACAAFALLAGSAQAQTPPAPEQPQLGAPGNEMPGDGAPPMDDACTVAPGDPAAGSADGNQMLTDQLDECESILVPQTDGDPEMNAPVPDVDPGTTPVIPPGTLPAQPAQPN